MSYSRSLAIRSAIDLNGLALGMWETARLLTKESTREAGHRKLNRLRDRVRSVQARPGISESLEIYLNQEFAPQDYLSLMDRLESGDPKALMPEIAKLVGDTNGPLDDVARDTADLRRAL